MVDEPAVQRVLIDAVMDTRVIKHDHGRSAIALSDKPVEKRDNVGTFDGPGARGIDKAVFGEIQCTKDVAPAMMVGLNGVGQSPW